MGATIDMIGIVVKDMETALAFYRLLGFEFPDGAEQEGHVEVITPNGYRIAWDTEELIKSFDPDWKAPSGSRIGLAFKCNNPGEVDRLYKQFVDRGYRSKKEPWDAFWGQRYSTILDPDGNAIDLFASLG